ncbi:MAG: signal peptide peptidase SppA [Planctomycetaceae bacterium]|jgi:protease IV|nr:signal peptide peptidase SppA [Planctomycetaceae bacterium]
MTESANPQPANTPQIIVNVPDPHKSTWKWRLLIFVLFISIMVNLQLVTLTSTLSSESSSVQESYHSGDKDADAKIVRIEVTGTIMAPFTEKTIEFIQEAAKQEDVKGVLLVVDSPGGLVTDSHQIYHEMKKLSEKKPVYVAMKDMAASGGYYISMGIGTKGKIYAEPTTWTGSIGVILPRYNATEMAQKLGVKPEPIRTGPLKGSLSPFRDMTEEEMAVWTEIIDDSFDRFLSIIDANRENLDKEQVRALATGQVYTASQALENGLVDAIGFEEDAIAALKTELGLKAVNVVTYSGPPTIYDVLMGSAKASAPEEQWRSIMEMTVPKAMYYCSWLPISPTTR